MDFTYTMRLMSSLQITIFIHFVYNRFTWLLWLQDDFQLFQMISRFLKEISTSSAQQVSRSIKAFVLDGQITTDSVVYPHVLLQLP